MFEVGYSAQKTMWVGTNELGFYASACSDPELIVSKLWENTIGVEKEKALAVTVSWRR